VDFHSARNLPRPLELKDAGNQTVTTPTLEARVAHLEGIVEEMRSRLTAIESRLTSLEGRIQTQFLALVGVLVSMWVTLIVAILLGS
jgi:hypothetical protein